MTTQDTSDDFTNQELIGNIARVFGISKHTAAMKSVRELVAAHVATECQRARIDELDKLHQNAMYNPDCQGCYQHTCLIADRFNALSAPLERK
jgi:hypothetical protein